MIKTVYDTIVVGSGFAGCAAAIYIGMANLQCLMIAGELPGGLITTTQVVDNYPGTPNRSGMQLATDMLEHAGKYSKIIHSKVVKIEIDNGIKMIELNDGSVHYAKTVIICTGSFPRKLPQFKDNVNYCAICDGFLYKDKIVAIIGGGNSAFEAASYLSNICKKVYLVHRRTAFRAFHNIVKHVQSLANVEILVNQEPVQYEGVDLTLSTTNIKVDGVFVCVGYLPNTSFLPPAIALDEMGHIIVNEKLETSVPGIYAAGDVVEKPYKQGVIAAAEGTTAALHIINLLNQGV